MISQAHMDILADRALDIELVDRLGFESVPRAGGEALVIPFHRDGKVVRRKYRRFDVTDGDGPKWTQDKGGAKAAFNEDCLRDESLLGQALIITEGELDAVSAIQAGLLRTISVPDGAPPPGERSEAELASSAKYDWLAEIKPFLTKDRVPEIILATDGDENGAALLQDLSVLLGRFRCKFVTYPKGRKIRGHADAPRERCKDLNEVLEDYGVKGVVETITRAKWIQVDGVYLMSELAPARPMTIYEPRDRLIAENIKLRLGDFSVWTGVPGFGKSTYLNHLLCGVADHYQARVAWASFEQEPQTDHKRNLRTWFLQGGDLFAIGSMSAADAWIDKHHAFIVPSEDDDPTLEWLLDKMEVAVVRFGVRIIVIDPWNEVEHARAHGETETEYTGRAIRSLKRFAKAFSVHVCVVAHPTKSVKDADGVYKAPTLYDISGSANWYNKADLGVIIHRPDEDNTTIKVQKSRYHEIIGKPGMVRAHFTKEDRRYVEQERLV